MAYLTVIQGPSNGETHPIGAGMFVIGRGAGVRAQLRGEFSSREHARICFDEQRREFLIEDIGSALGTYVNGDRLTPGIAVALADCDLISAGESVLEFRMGDPPKGSSRPILRVTRDNIRRTRVSESDSPDSIPG